MNWKQPFESGVRIGWMISRMEALGREELERRAAELPEELRQVFLKLKRTQTVSQLWRETDEEEIKKLSVCVLEMSEEDLEEQLSQAVEAARERMEAEGLSTSLDFD